MEQDKTEELAAVEQCDRDAAAALCELYDHLGPPRMRAGLADKSRAVQAFARHRLSTRPKETPTEQGEPVAWLHTLHMEGGQTQERLGWYDGQDEDEPQRTFFGLPGRDYSEEYTVTSEPLYTHPVSTNAPATEQGEVAREALEALTAHAVHRECDYPGDSPVDCGLWCNLCEQHVEDDHSDHKPTCPIARLASLSHPVSTHMQVAEAVREACRNEADKRAMNWLVAREISAAIGALELSTITASSTTKGDGE